MVPPVGLEPTLLAEPDFESGVSTNFTTEARRADSSNIYKFSLGAAAYFPHILYQNKKTAANAAVFKS